MDKIKHLADVQRLIRILIYLLIWFIHHEHIKKIKKKIQTLLAFRDCGRQP